MATQQQSRQLGKDDSGVGSIACYTRTNRPLSRIAPTATLANDRLAISDRLGIAKSGKKPSVLCYRLLCFSLQYPK